MLAKDKGSAVGGYVRGMVTKPKDGMYREEYRQHPSSYHKVNRHVRSMEDQNMWKNKYKYQDYPMNTKFVS